MCSGKDNHEKNLQTAFKVVWTCWALCTYYLPDYMKLRRSEIKWENVSAFFVYSYYMVDMCSCFIILSKMAAAFRWALEVSHLLRSINALMYPFRSPRISLKCDRLFEQIACRITTVFSLLWGCWELSLIMSIKHGTAPAFPIASAASWWAATMARSDRDSYQEFAMVGNKLQ